MALKAKDIDELQKYADGVMGRADHRAGKVKAIALALLGGIVWRAEAGSIRLKSYDGSPANILWAKINGSEYAFAYNHKTEKIEIRDRTLRGDVLHEVDDQTAISELERLFRDQL